MRSEIPAGGRSGALHPLLALAASLPVFLLGIFLSKGALAWYYPPAVALLYVVFGYGQAFVRITLVTLPFIIFAALLSLLSFQPEQAVLNGLRSYCLVLAAVLTLSIHPLSLVRCLNQLRVPRIIGLGLLITLRFFTVLAQEMQRIHRAMKSRGVSSVLQRPSLLYRAFMMPLIMRLFSLSDILALSLETRAFRPEAEASAYQPVRWRLKDSLFVLALLALIGGALYAQHKYSL